MEVTAFKSEQSGIAASEQASDIHSAHGAENKNADWDGITLEEIVRTCAREGRLAEIVPLIKPLPESVQAKYRAIAKDEIEKTRAGQ